jgi:quercetin dioxygenase-like cupin family protein
MYVFKTAELPEETLNSNLFTGTVRRQPLATSSKDYNVAIINFDKGIRNKLHTHGSDQILIVTDGEGIVATKESHHKVTCGDVILIPAGEQHWHGASTESIFSHIALTTADSEIVQIEE